MAGSRLGDLGFQDEKGAWHTVLNVLDKASCSDLGVQPLKLSHALQHYITQAKYGEPQEPYLKIPDGWNWDVIPDGLIQTFLCCGNAR